MYDDCMATVPSSSTTPPVSVSAATASPFAEGRGSDALGVASKRWTRAEFQQLDAEGWFPETRVELIDGVIVEMPPASPDHWCSAEVLRALLAAAFGEGYYARLEAPLATGDHSQPVPDVAIVEGAVRDHFDEHPSTACLAVEVSKTTQRYDKSTKADHYASVGIGDYWVLDLVARELTVHREPREHSESAFGHRYTQITVLDEAQTVRPLAKPDAELSVAQMLPPAVRQES